MLRFKNKLDACHHYRPGGESESVPVDAGQVVETAGTVARETDTAYVVDNNGQLRAWPKSRWKLEDKDPVLSPVKRKDKVEDLPA